MQQKSSDCMGHTPNWGYLTLTDQRVLEESVGAPSADR